MSLMNNETKQMLRSPMFVLVAVVMGWIVVAFLVMPTVQLLLTVFAPDPAAGMGPWEKLAASNPAKRS